ncbi:MAG: citrate synthase [Candidatus Xenolissoclinum pacificiensis L6]|uniref:Citrate synthase n=1 Tax=Candidatus Xenolissoclinum pacificiensis L6 TaxID=1401685 RepID=W2UZJ1_9RICK|nr:MAG: citrate synthase [Candidatus Xenolissoclinum pacificiensis L6]
MKKNLALLRVGDKSVELEVEKSSYGPDAIDVRKLYKELGYFTYDPGFFSTASCRSSITFIDGESGVLRYRGHDILDIVEKHDFLDVAHLLFFSHFPDEQERKKFVAEIKKYSTLDKQIVSMIEGLPFNSHPMAVLISAITLLVVLYPGFDVEESFYLLLAKIPIILSAYYQHSIGCKIESIHYTDSYAKNFLYNMLGADDEDFAYAIEKFLILHADHEQNASTSTARMVCSTQAPIISCISSAVCSLWGALHGGANEKVIHMIERIVMSGKSFDDVLQNIKDPGSNFRLMGFGHRVYKNYDPRAKVLKDICDKLSNSETLLISQEMFDMATKLESHALQDEYFKKRSLYPNVDFYSGLILKGIGVPVDMFTTLFVMGRVVGWLSQIKEMTEDSDTKLYRPRQVYQGE